MLREMRENKYFWMSLGLVILVPFIVYWNTKGFDWAMRSLTATALVLLTVFTPLRVAPRRRYRRDNDNNYAQESINGIKRRSLSHFSFDTASKIAEFLSDPDSLRKREQDAMRRIKTYLWG